MSIELWNKLILLSVLWAISCSVYKILKIIPIQKYRMLTIYLHYKTCSSMFNEIKTMLLEKYIFYTNIYMNPCIVYLPLDFSKAILSISNMFSTSDCTWVKFISPCRIWFLLDMKLMFFFLRTNTELLLYIDYDRDFILLFLVMWSVWV